MGGRAFNFGGGVDTALWLETPPPKKRDSIDPPPPQFPTETEPGALEVARTQNSAKNENGTFGISVSWGFRIIQNHQLFAMYSVKKNCGHFQCKKNFLHLRRHRLTDS